MALSDPAKVLLYNREGVCLCAVVFQNSVGPVAGQVSHANHLFYHMFCFVSLFFSNVTS